VSAFEIVPSPWVSRPPLLDSWLRRHGDDEIPVKLIDLLSLVGRLEEAESDPDGFTAYRLYSCDLPRIRAYLPPEALEEL
jgi:hypothetical protein